MTENQKRRRYDNFEDSCPMTPEQIKVMLANQERLMVDMADIKKYLFAGRVVVGTLVFIGLTLDWTRDHINFIKYWLTSK